MNIRPTGQINTHNPVPPLNRPNTTTATNQPANTNPTTDITNTIKEIPYRIFLFSLIESYKELHLKTDTTPPPPRDKLTSLANKINTFLLTIGHKMPRHLPITEMYSYEETSLSLNHMNEQLKKYQSYQEDAKKQIEDLKKNPKTVKDSRTLRPPPALESSLEEILISAKTQHFAKIQDIAGELICLKTVCTNALTSSDINKQITEITLTLNDTIEKFKVILENRQLNNDPQIFIDNSDINKSDISKIENQVLNISKQGVRIHEQAQETFIKLQATYQKAQAAYADYLKLYSLQKPKPQTAPISQAQKNDAKKSEPKQPTNPKARVTNPHNETQESPSSPSASITTTSITTTNKTSGPSASSSLTLTLPERPQNHFLIALNLPLSASLSLEIPPPKSMVLDIPPISTLTLPERPQNHFLIALNLPLSASLSLEIPPPKSMVLNIPPISTLTNTAIATIQKFSPATPKANTNSTYVTDKAPEPSSSLPE